MEVAEFIAKKRPMTHIGSEEIFSRNNSIVTNDSLLEVSENSVVPKSLMVYKLPRFCFFGFIKYQGFSFLTITETVLMLIQLV